MVSVMNPSLCWGLRGQSSGWTQKGVSSSETWISPLSVCLLKNGENAATPIILFLGHLSRSVLPSGLHCPNLSSSGLLVFWHASCMRISLCLATVIAWVLLFISLSFVVVPLLLGDFSFLSLSRLSLDLTGLSRPFLDFWLAASFVNTIISAFLPSRVVILCLRILCLRLDFLFIWFLSFRLDSLSSSSWLISFVWKHYVSVSLFARVAWKSKGFRRSPSSLLSNDWIGG